MLGRGGSLSPNAHYAFTALVGHQWLQYDVQPWLRSCVECTESMVQQNHKPSQNHQRHLASSGALPPKNFKALGIYAFFFLFVYLQDYLYSIFNRELIELLSLSATQLGHLSSLSFYSTMLSLIPIGILYDLKSNRQLMIVAAVISLLSAVIFFFASSFGGFACNRLLCGIATSFAFVGGLRAISISGIKKTVVTTGIFFAIGNLSGAVASGPYLWLKLYSHWQVVLAFNCLVSLSILILMYKWLPCDRPVDDMRQLSFWHQLKKAYQNLMQASLNINNWLCGLFAGILCFPDTLFAGLWGIVYFTQKYNFSEIEAGLVISSFTIGIALGAPLLGVVADRTPHKRLVMMIACLCCVLLTWLLVHPLWTSLLSLILLCVTLGLFDCVEVIAFACIQSSPQKEQMGTSLGFVISLMSLLNAIIQPIFGARMDEKWSGTWLNGTRVYGVEALDHAVIMVPCAFFVAMMLAYFIKEEASK